MTYIKVELELAEKTVAWFEERARKRGLRDWHGAAENLLDEAAGQGANTTRFVVLSGLPVVFESLEAAEVEASGQAVENQETMTILPVSQLCLGNALLAVWKGCEIEPFDKTEGSDYR